MENRTKRLQENMFNKRNINLITFATILFILSPVISLQEVANPSFIYICLIFALILVSYLNEKEKISFSNHHFYAYLFCLTAILSTIIKGDLNESIFIEIVKFIVFTICYILITGATSIYTTSRFKAIFKTYIYLAILLAVLVTLSYIFGFYHTDSEYFLGRTSIGITGLYKNPNYIESFILLAFYLLLYRLMFFKKSFYDKTISIIFIFLMYVSSYLSGTRAAILSFTICIITVVFYWSKKNNKLFKISIIILIISLVGYYMYVEDIQRYYSLFLGNRELLSDDGRSQTWYDIIQNVFLHPFLGLGLTSANTLAKNIGSMSSIHNVFLELITNIGFIGFAIFTSMIFSNYKQVKKHDRALILMFLFFSAFPMLFQNGFVAVNFWKFMILNRLIVEYSVKTDCGIKGLLKQT